MTSEINIENNVEPAETESSLVKVQEEDEDDFYVP